MERDSNRIGTTNVKGNPSGLPAAAQGKTQIRALESVFNTLALQTEWGASRSQDTINQRDFTVLPYWKVCTISIEQRGSKAVKTDYFSMNFMKL